MKNLTDIIDGKGNSSANPCIKLFELLFKSITDAPVTHLIQDDRSYAKHMALGSYYDTLPGLLDTLFETYKAIYPVEELQIPACSKIANCEAYFTNLYKSIENARASIKESFLISQLDDIQEEVAQLLYKLKFVK